MTEIVNKVAQSGLITFNLEEYLPKNLIDFDLEPFLFQGLILKEKDFRASLKEHNWDAYQEKDVCLFCSADAIIPHWAYMLLSSYLVDVANSINFGTQDQCKKKVFLEKLNALDTEAYKDKRIIIKGCGEAEVETYAYVEITRIFLPVAKSIMYGEPCSTVPIYKKKK